jgi:hypothetical protein
MILRRECIKVLDPIARAPHHGSDTSTLDRD